MANREGQVKISRTKRLPKTLFKHMPITYQEAGDRARSVIVDHSVYFAKRTDFNDPFDCVGNWEMSASDEDVRDQYVRVFMTLRDDVTESQLRAEADKMISKGAFRSEEALRQARDLAQQGADELGVCCLNAAPENILLWSHYAREHRGICLGFDTGFAPFSEAANVRYSDEYPVVRYFDRDWNNAALSLMFTKYTCWAYEREWRLVEPASGPYLYPPESLRYVILGCSTSDSDADLVRSMVAEGGAHAQVVTSTRSSTAYRLEFDHELVV